MTTAQEIANETGGTSERHDRRPVWIRGAFMLFFLIAFSVAQALVALMAVVQFLSLLITRKSNTFVAGFGRSLGVWLGQTARFQSADSDERPFPWAPWPGAH